MREEYGHARLLAVSLAQVLWAHDEIKMVNTWLHLREHEDGMSLNNLTKAKLPSTNVQYTLVINLWPWTAWQGHKENFAI